MNTFPLKIENSASIFALNQCYSTVQEILAISIRNKVVFADNITFHGFPGCSAGKESACNEGDLGSIPGLGRSSGEGISYPIQYSGLENSMDCKESDMTEQFSLSLLLPLALYGERRVNCLLL